MDFGYMGDGYLLCVNLLEYMLLQGGGGGYIGILIIILSLGI